MEVAKADEQYKTEFMHSRKLMQELDQKESKIMFLEKENL